jgi:hypothetical protein
MLVQAFGAGQLNHGEFPDTDIKGRGGKVVVEEPVRNIESDLQGSTVEIFAYSAPSSKRLSRQMLTSAYFSIAGYLSVVRSWQSLFDFMRCDQVRVRGYRATWTDRVGRR